MQLPSLASGRRKHGRRRKRLSGIIDAHKGTIYLFLCHVHLLPSPDDPAPDPPLFVALTTFLFFLFFSTGIRCISTVSFPYGGNNTKAMVPF